MLETLHIRNLALVTSLDIDFGEGLNTVTGETGAGKSLIIGALQLLAGGRAAPSVIRKGEKNCEVAGVFALGQRCANLRKELDQQLENAGIPLCEENRLLLRRVITESGSRAYVNGSMVTAGFLKEITENLIDIHGPHDNQTLLLPARQLSLLDTYAGLNEEAANTASLYSTYRNILDELDKIKAQGLAPEEASLLEFQLREIEKADLKQGEEEAVLKKYKLASSSRRLIDLAAAARNALCDGDGSVEDILAAQLRALRELEQLDPDKGGDIIEQLENCAECIQELGSQISDYMDGLEVDQDEIQRMEKRLDLIQRLKRKYGPSLDDVLETANRIRERLNNIRNMGERSGKLAQEADAALKSFLEASAVLSGHRTQAAPLLAAAIQEKLRGLGFLRAEFRIEVKGVKPGPSGGDSVEFQFAPNVGEDLQPLRQVASSGEVARVMLAVKAVLSDADSVPVLVFDEIDANIGGRVAVTVAEELKCVGVKHQVFSITHLPQIAAAGSRHYLVEKTVSDERTSTAMTLLDGKERLDEIVRMLGAERESSAALGHAKELLGL